MERYNKSAMPVNAEKIVYNHIYMERYNKSTMPVNAEKIVYDPPWDSNS